MPRVLQIMKTQLRSIVRLLPALILAAVYGTAADQVQCPAQVAVRQQIGAPIAGWSAVIDDLPQRLAGITFFDGKPEEKASLAPDSESKMGGKYIRAAALLYLKYLLGRSLNVCASAHSGL